MVNAVGKALVRDNMMKDKKFYTLTADYYLRPTISRAPQSRSLTPMAVKLIGDEAGPRPDVTYFSPYLLKIPQSKPDVVCSNLAGNQVHQSDQAIGAEFGLPYPIVGFNLQHPRTLGRRRRQSERHLADGSGITPRTVPASKTLSPTSPEEREAAGKPRLDRHMSRWKMMAQAMNETKSTRHHRQADRLFREGKPSSTS